jgi:DNA-binding MarR family transcriptional regulator
MSWVRTFARAKGGDVMGDSREFVGTQTGALCGAPNGGTNGVHIRNKPKTPDGRLLQDRPDKNYRWSAMVWAVLVDRSLEPVDWGVFACFGSREFKTDTFQLGSRWIAETLGIRKGRVQASIARLVKAQHVEIVVPAKGARPPLYRLTSPVFAHRQKVIVRTAKGNKMSTRDRLRLEQALRSQSA